MILLQEAAAVCAACMCGRLDKAVQAKTCDKVVTKLSIHHCDVARPMFNRAGTHQIQTRDSNMTGKAGLLIETPPSL